jgi:hypothetical protein
MKTRLIVSALLGAVALAATSTVVAYRQGYSRGYRHGGDAERACWNIDPAPTKAMFQGEITARRDTTKHPLLKGRLDLRGSRSVNSIPARIDF